MRSQFYADGKTIILFAPDVNGVNLKITEGEKAKIEQEIINQFSDGVPGNFMLFFVPDRSRAASRVVGRSKETFCQVIGTESARDFIHACGIGV